MRTTFSVSFPGEATVTGAPARLASNDEWRWLTVLIPREFERAIACGDWGKAATIMRSFSLLQLARSLTSAADLAALHRAGLPQSVTEQDMRDAGYAMSVGNIDAASFGRELTIAQKADFIEKSAIIYRVWYSDGQELARRVRALQQRYVPAG